MDFRGIRLGRCCSRVDNVGLVFEGVCGVYSSTLLDDNQGHETLGLPAYIPAGRLVENAKGRERTLSKELGMCRDTCRPRLHS